MNSLDYIFLKSTQGRNNYGRKGCIESKLEYLSTSMLIILCLLLEDDGEETNCSHTDTGKNYIYSSTF